jgi:hypothetical protein
MDVVAVKLHKVPNQIQTEGPKYMTQIADYEWSNADQTWHLRPLKAVLADILRANQFGWVDCSGMQRGEDTDNLLLYITHLRDDLIAWCESDQQQ